MTRKATQAAQAASPESVANRPSLNLERGQRVRLADQLYSQIFDQITSGVLNIGDKLPSEHQICRQFGVSRPVVREAMLRLRSDGLISARQGSGTYVSHQPSAKLNAFDEVSNISTYLRAQEIRETLEGDAARLAATRHTDEQLRAIRKAHEEFADCIHHGQEAIHADLAFHRSIAEASGNHFYLDVLDNIYEAVYGFMKLTLALTKMGSRQRGLQVISEHESIVQAIAEGDAERASVCMRFHIGQARKRLVDRKKDL